MIALLSPLFSSQEKAQANETSEIYFSGGGTQMQGYDFDVSANLNPKGNTICSLVMNASFPPNLMEVVSIQANPESPYSMVIEKNYSNTTGKIQFTAGAPGCSTQATTIYTIKFRPKSHGNALLKFKNPKLATVNNIGIPYRIPNIYSDLLIPLKSPSLSSPTMTLTNGGTQKIASEFYIPVILNSNGSKICAVSGDFKFAKDYLEVVAIEGGTTYPMVIEKRFSNVTGNVYFTAGAPGCTTANSTVFKVKFRVKKEAFSTLNFASTAKIGTVDSNGIPYSLPFTKYSTWVSPK